MSAARFWEWAPTEVSVRGVTLVEMMVTVAIIGLLATLAVPQLTPLVTHYRATEDARSVLAAVNQGRGLAQRTNAPVEVAFHADRVVLRTPQLAPGTSDEAVRKLVTGFVDARAVALPSGARVTAFSRAPLGGAQSVAAVGSPAAVVRFCPSSDTYFREGPQQTPVCGVGNLASHDARVTVGSRGEQFSVQIAAILGTVDLRQAP